MNTKRLKGEIIAKFGTQTKFCEAIGWHRNKVSKMVCNKYIPDVDEAEKIAEILNLSEALYIAIFLPRSSPNGDVLAS